MPSFKSEESARTILGGVELVQMMGKRGARYAFDPQLTLLGGGLADIGAAARHWFGVPASAASY